MKRRIKSCLFQYLFLLLCIVGYTTPTDAQQVQVKTDEKKLYSERAESVIKNFFSSLETYREMNMSSEILLEIQRNCLWKGSNNTARFFEDFTQAGHGKAYKQSTVRDYLRNYCYTFNEDQTVYVTIENIQFDNLYREGDHYYMKVRFTRLFESGNKLYRYPLEAVCNFSPGINNINKGGIQSIDKRNSDFQAENTRERTTTTTPRGSTTRPVTPRPVAQEGSATAAASGTSSAKMNQEELRLFQQGKKYYSDNQFTQAEQCLRQLSSYPEVYFYLGYIYSYPKETKNTALGFYYTSKAAGAGVTAAQNNLGQMYEEGVYVRKDLRKAFEWYMEAARKDNAKAMYNIGRFCYNGIYVSRDYDTAFRWYLTSFNKSVDGVTAARIGECLYYGHGCEQDFSEAVEFLEFAQSKGKGNKQLLDQAKQKISAQLADNNKTNSGSLESAYRWAYENAKMDYFSDRKHGRKPKETNSGKTTTNNRSTGIRVEGKVQDKNGEPIIGASVVVKGTTIGGITDIDGNFALTVPSNQSTLEVAFVGYKDVQVKAASKVTVVLK